MCPRLADLPSRVIQTRLREAFGRFPVLRRVALRVLEPAYRVALFPFRRAQGRGEPTEQATLVDQTEDYNLAAERYFVEFENPEFLLGKPFSEPSLFSKHLIDVGVLVDGARLQPGDTVVEIGAGSGWLSHFLNRFGCRTIAVDISPTALDFGRTLFERDPQTNWSLDPQFLAYDGHTIPLADAVCDRIIVSDAFHHIPNQRELLQEMHRLLRPDGVVAMSEPGRGHGTAPISVAETEQTGVLENELVIEDVASLAESVGFTAVTLLAASPTIRHEFPARDLGRFMGGKGFARYWKALCSGLDRHHYIVMYKGRTQPTTERPAELNPRIQVLAGPATVSARVGAGIPVVVSVANLGDTVWLHRGVGDPARGWTRLGGHLFEVGATRRLVDHDWCRESLAVDIGPGDSRVLRFDLPPLDRAGQFLVEFDLVIEGALWFASGGTCTAVLRIDVEVDGPS
jgi:SAM-dependent methyltransferase